MSKTPVLTKKQQKSSLSAKKLKTKETIRNVLATPYSKYWPLVSNGHSQILRNVLTQCLPKLLPDKVQIPWAELGKVPKSERKKFRDQYTDEHFGPDYCKRSIEERDGLILGINDVTKALEKEEAKYVLIAEDILPRLMVEHVIDQAVLLGTPVLVVPELRNIVKEKCGISGVVIAFTDCSKFKLVQDNIKDISKKYPIPENHINLNRSLKLPNESVIIIEDSIADISTTNLMNTTNPIVDISTEKTEMKNLVESKFENIEPVQNVHLIRTTNNKRVFIPEKCLKKPKKDGMDVDSSGFLSLSTDSPCKQKVEKEYMTLKVLRIKGDTNRTKRKIQALKQKKSKHKGNKKL